MSFETTFLENEKLFQKTGVPFFSWKYLIENAPFPNKTVLSEASVRQIEYGVQNEPITKNGVLPITDSFFFFLLFFVLFCFLKILFQFKSYSELIWYTNYLNVLIHAFCKRWSFFWDDFSLWLSLKLGLEIKNLVIFRGFFKNFWDNWEFSIHWLLF